MGSPVYCVFEHYCSTIRTDTDIYFIVKQCIFIQELCTIIIIVKVKL